MYVASVGRNANLIIGAVPDRRGLIPDADAARYAELGRMIRERFGTPLAQTSGAGSEVLLQLPELARIHDIMIQEDITGGERVREFAVTARGAGGNWIDIGSGTCIGHKLILPVDDIACNALKLTVSRSVGDPEIRSFAAFGA